MDCHNLDFAAARTTRPLPGLAAALLSLAVLACDAPTARAQVAEKLSHSEDAIRQEVIFHASPARVYAALTTTSGFDRVVRLSAAMKSGMKLGTSPTVVSHVAGGAFSSFGGYITGRQIELVPNQRIVQVWRAGSWDAGSYSLARFELSAQGSGDTKLVFDHTGFPAGQTDHLAEGWRTNYWEPLAKYLGGSAAPSASTEKH